MRPIAGVVLAAVAVFGGGCDDGSDNTSRATHEDGRAGEVEAKGIDDDADAPILERFGHGDYPEYEGDEDRYLVSLGECLRDAGWPVEVSADGSELSLDDVVGEQRLLLMEAHEECRYAVGVPPPGDPLDDEQLSRLYDASLEVKACLESEGYDIAEPPSRERFIDSYYEDTWHPYSSIGPVGQDEYERLNEVCPQPALD